MNEKSLSAGNDASDSRIFSSAYFHAMAWRKIVFSERSRPLPLLSFNTVCVRMPEPVHTLRTAYLINFMFRFLFISCTDERTQQTLVRDSIVKNGIYCFQKCRKKRKIKKIEYRRLVRLLSNTRCALCTVPRADIMSLCGVSGDHLFESSLRLLRKSNSGFFFIVGFCANVVQNESSNYEQLGSIFWRRIEYAPVPHIPYSLHIHATTNAIYPWSHKNNKHKKELLHFGSARRRQLLQSKSEKWNAAQ